MPITLRYAARSDVGLGSKSRNEDSAYAGPELLVLCDGMGGHAGGDVASSLVVGELVHLDGESHGGDDLLEVLGQSVKDANARLHEESLNADELDGMGTTCIAMLRSGGKLAVANIGDSRAYLWRGGRFAQITKDHSFVQQLLDEGAITDEEALHHPQRSLITRVLTGGPEDEPDLSMRELRAGDRILICSDGLTDYVAHDTIEQIVAARGTAGEAADRLIQIALRASTRDNVTVVVADAVPSADTGSTNPQVAGAASERRGTHVIAPQTPAEKAAALSREARGDGPADADDVAPTLAEEETASRPVTWLRRLLFTVIALVVVAGSGYAAYDWTQRQFYVGEHEGAVAIYRGLSQDLGPFGLSSVESGTDIEVDQLPRYYQGRVRGTLSASSLDEAEQMVEALRTMSQECRPNGTPAPGCEP